MLHKEEIDIKILPNHYNLQDLFRKNTIVIDKELQHWMNDELYFLDAGWVYHFNCGVRPHPRAWMELTYDYLYRSIDENTK